MSRLRADPEAIERHDPGPFNTSEIAFGSHGGIGIRFGDRARFELGYRYQHLSNLGIGDSNPGINFHLVRLGYHF